MTQDNHRQTQTGKEEYVTIIAPSLSAVMGQFRARGLGAQGFTITGPAARHKFAFAGDHMAREAKRGPMFDGVAMVAATFRRVVSS